MESFFLNLQVPVQQQIVLLKIKPKKTVTWRRPPLQATSVACHQLSILYFWGTSEINDDVISYTKADNRTNEPRDIF